MYVHYNKIYLISDNQYNYINSQDLLLFWWFPKLMILENSIGTCLWSLIIFYYISTIVVL